MNINLLARKRFLLACAWLAGVWAAKAALPGALDSSYAPALDSTVNAIVCTADGKAYLGGAFTNVNGEAHAGIVRLNGDGSTDASFQIGAGAGAGSTVYALALQADGKLLLGGNFTQVNGVACANLARLNEDGSVDTGFLGAAPSTVYSLALQADGKILYGFSALARLNANGESDPEFQVNTLFGYAHAWDFRGPTVKSIVPMANGQIIFQGFFSTVAGVDYYGLARVQTNGTLDLAFPCLPQIVRPGDLLGGPIPAIGCLDVQADGQMLAGSSYAVFETWRKRLVKLNANGARDAEFAPDFPISDPQNGNTLTLVRALANGKILVSGDFSTVGGQSRNHFVRLTAAGDIDYEFDSAAGFDQPARAMALQPNGQYLVGGTFSTANGVAQPYLARLIGDSPSNTPPTIVNPPADLTVLAGQTAVLSIAAAGDSLRYQWLRDNSPMLQATNPFLTISNAQITDAGGYSTVVSGGGIQVTSAVATLAVMTIGEALNCPDWEFSSWFTYSTPGGWQASGISNAWKYQTNITHDGMAGIQSLTLSVPALSVYPYSFLQTRLRGPGRLVFYGQGGDTVRISNGAMAVWNGASLQPYEIEIADGWQTVTWQAYCIPGAIIVLDGFRFEPATPVFTASGARFSASGFQCPLQMNPTNVPFRIEWSADLKNWQSLIEITNYQDGLLLEDNTGATNACRFYRAVK